jgi:hypothetical protein
VDGQSTEIIDGTFNSLKESAPPIAMAGKTPAGSERRTHDYVGGKMNMQEDARHCCGCTEQNKKQAAPRKSNT